MNQPFPLRRHDLLSLGGEPADYRRVLWVDQFTDRVVTIRVSFNGPTSSTWPSVEKLSDILDDIDEGHTTLQEYAEYRDLRIDSEIPPLHRAKRDADWKVIKDYVENEPECYYKPNWTAFIADAQCEWSLTRPTIVRLLRVYWTRGLNVNALVPLFNLRGGKGKPRIDTGVKKGRPRTVVPLGMNQPPAGINITADERRFFALAIDREYEINSRLSLRSAYDQCIGMFFADRAVDPLDPTRVTLKARDGFAESGFPTFEQFRYWVGKDRNLEKVARTRETPRVYDLNNRGLPGTSSAEAWSPGSRFQIDATVADTYLRSKLDRNLLIGRPVIYVVVDVFSRLIVGVYVGLEGPSWIAAMMALANAVADKKAYCASFGINIEDHDWPARHLPSIILGDRGELESTGVAKLLETYSITCENAAAWRPDWKGIVESRFRILQQAFKPFVPGYVDTDFRQRGTRDYRGDAVLNLDEFERIIIRLVLYFNNHHELKTFDRHPGMIEDRVPSIPIEMWNWGIASVGGLPRSPTSEQVRWALMPRDTATVTDRGIKYQGRFYDLKRAHSDRWLERARKKGRFPVDIGFDKRFVDQLYVANPSAPMGFDTAVLTDRSREARGASGWESEGLLQVAKAMSAQNRDAEVLRRLETQVDIQRDVEVAASDPTIDLGSLASQVKGVKKNREDEKEARRATESQAFIPGPPPSVLTPSNVHPIRPEVNRSSHAARPSYRALREDTDDE